MNDWGIIIYVSHIPINQMFHISYENWKYMYTQKPVKYVYVYTISKTLTKITQQLYQSHRKQSGHLIEVVIVPNDV